ncbi:MAG: PqqD family protein [Ruminococcus sp.]|nr:PqqD family protein [Ruminococcus sp.]
MKLNKNFITHEAGKESMLVPMGGAKFSGLVKGNKMLGEVLELLKNDTTEAKIVSTLRSKYEAPEGVVEKDIHKVIAELKKIGAIDG